jgi:hypothetical protein
MKKPGGREGASAPDADLKRDEHDDAHEHAVMSERQQQLRQDEEDPHLTQQWEYLKQQQRERGTE